MRRRDSNFLFAEDRGFAIDLQLDWMSALACWRQLRILPVCRDPRAVRKTQTNVDPFNCVAVIVKACMARPSCAKNQEKVTRFQGVQL